MHIVFIYSSLMSWFQLGLKDHQQDHANRILEIIRTCGYALDTSATGSGKTIVALKTAQNLGVDRILVFCPSETLRSKWYDEFQKVHGSREAAVAVPDLYVSTYSKLRKNARVNGLIDWKCVMPPKLGPQLHRFFFSNTLEELEESPSKRSRTTKSTKISLMSAQTSRKILLVVDETHAAKNAFSQTTQALTMISDTVRHHGGYALHLSATPLDHVDQLANRIRLMVGGVTEAKIHNFMNQVATITAPVVEYAYGYEDILLAAGGKSRRPDGSMPDTRTFVEVLTSIQKQPKWQREGQRLLGLIDKEPWSEIARLFVIYLIEHSSVIGCDTELYMEVFTRAWNRVLSRMSAATPAYKRIGMDLFLESLDTKAETEFLAADVMYRSLHPPSGKIVVPYSGPPPGFATLDSAIVRWRQENCYGWTVRDSTYSNYVSREWVLDGGFGSAKGVYAWNLTLRKLQAAPRPDAARIQSARIALQMCEASITSAQLEKLKDRVENDRVRFEAEYHEQSEEIMIQNGGVFDDRERQLALRIRQRLRKAGPGAEVQLSVYEQSVLENYPEEESGVSISGSTILRSRVQELELRKTPALVEHVVALLQKHPTLKIVLMFNYLISLKKCFEQLQEHLGEDACVRVQGSVKQSVRKDIFAAFNDRVSGVRVLCATIHTAKEGIDLHDEHGTHPRAMFIMANFAALPIVQASGRTYRTNVKSHAPVFLVYAGAATGGDLEKRIYARLSQRSKSLHLAGAGDDTSMLPGTVRPQCLTKAELFEAIDETLSHGCFRGSDIDVTVASRQLLEDSKELQYQHNRQAWAMLEYRIRLWPLIRATLSRLYIHQTNLDRMIIEIEDHIHTPWKHLKDTVNLQSLFRLNDWRVSWIEGLENSSDVFHRGSDQFEYASAIYQLKDDDFVEKLREPCP